jgi:hypothetical protein
VLRVLRSHPPPGVRTDSAARTIWRTCGGPLADVPVLLDILVSAELVAVNDDRFRLTRSGNTIATQDHQHGGTRLALALIRAGHFSDQGRALIESGAIDPGTGEFTCPRALAMRAAPQLVGILRRFPSVVLAQAFTVPPDLVRELADVWAVPTKAFRDDRRQDIGDRGELFTYRYERLRATDPAKIHWVALDDDSLGYDIEDLNATPRRRIEAKASSGNSVRFILSANEWQVAHENADSYEVHFWGGVNLARSERDDYDALRRAGFPLVYRNVPRQLTDAALTAVAASYLVTVP